MTLQFGIWVYLKHDDPSYQNAEKNVANNDSQIEKL